MSINIKVENFEGPFDLLLHLIKKNEMSIYNVNLSEITNQYMEYLNKMQELDLDIASEFIVIAATLLEVKSKALLPKPTKEETSEEENNISQEDLIAKLLEYNKFKYVAGFLHHREDFGSGMVYAKLPEIIEDKEEVNLSELLKNTTLVWLYNLYSKLMKLYYSKKNDNEIPKQVSLDVYRIEDKMEELKNVFSQKKSSLFSDVIIQCNSRIEVIVTFLAVLELIRLNQLKVVQESNYSDIYMESRV